MTKGCYTLDYANNSERVVFHGGEDRCFIVSVWITDFWKLIYHNSTFFYRGIFILATMHVVSSSFPPLKSCPAAFALFANGEL